MPYRVRVGASKLFKSWLAKAVAIYAAFGTLLSAARLAQPVGCISTTTLAVPRGLSMERASHCENCPVECCTRLQR